MPIGPDGNWTPFLTQADQQTINARAEEGRVRLASQSLGARFVPRTPDGSPLGKARAAVTDVYLTANNLLPAFNGIRSYKDPSLTVEEQAAEREGQLAAVHKALARRSDDATERSSNALAAADAEAAKYRPTLDANDMAQMMRTDQAWNNTIRPQLEKGKSWDQILPSLDADGLLAVQRFAPGHEAAARSRFDQHEVPAVVAGIQRMAGKRMIDIAPDGPAKDALKQHAEVQRVHDVVTAAASHFKGLSTVAGLPTNDIVAGLQTGIKSAAFNAGAQLGDAAETGS